MFCFQSSYDDDKVSSRSILIARCLCVCVLCVYATLLVILSSFGNIESTSVVEITQLDRVEDTCHIHYLVSNQMLCECYCLEEVVISCIFTWWHWSRTEVNVRSLVQTLRALCTTTTFFKWTTTTLFVTSHKTFSL